MITSSKNQHIKHIIALKKKAKERKTQECYIVEGSKMILETPVESIVRIYYSETYYNMLLNNNTAVHSCHEVVKDSVFDQICDTVTPQGVLAIVKQTRSSIDNLLSIKNPLIIIGENIQDPGNLGTIIRAAEGAGVNGIILTNDCVDIHNPKVVRSTMGSIFRVPIVIIDDLIDILNKLKKYGVTIYAAHLEGNVYYDNNNYKKGTAFLLGNESAGLSDIATENADLKIKIPLLGKVESLNVAIAASLLMYEAANQKRRK